MLLAGCAQPILAPDSATAASSVAARPPAAPKTQLAAKPPSADTVAALNLARQRVQTAKRTVGQFSDADATLALADAASAEGNNPRAQSLARQAEARADYALQTHFTRKAAAELALIYATTGLDDNELGQLRAAEAALIRGQSSLALSRLQDLRKIARAASRTFTVERGQTLSGIAARPEVYGNSLLWPLIWAANKATVPDPNRLRAGQQLIIRPHPTVDEVVKAIEMARQNPARLKVGPVVPATP